MSRQTRRKRRSLGKCEEKTIKGRRYLYYSFVTPEWAFSKWPELKLGARQWHSVLPENEYEGEAWLSAAQRDIKAGIWVPDALKKAEARRESITFREYAVPWVERRKKKNGTDLKETAKQKYRESLELYLLDYFGDIPLTSIKTADVQKWWDEFKPVRLDADLEDRRYHVYKHLKTILEDAATEPIDDAGNTLIAANPCRIRAARPKAKHVPVRPTPEQMTALLEAMPEYVRMVARICDGAALREGEALGLCVKHIDFDHMKIKVRQQVQRIKDDKNPGRYKTVILTPKTDSSIDDVAMSPALASDIRDWMDSRNLTDPESPLFVGVRTGDWITPATYRKAIADAKKKVPGLENMRPHDLRKDFLSTILDEGGTVAEVMRQGRHTTMAVASKYQVTSEDHMNDVLNRVDSRTKPASADAAPDVPADAGEDDIQALAGVIDGMPLEDRVTLLKTLTAEKRALILDVMEKTAKLATLTELLK